MNNNDGGYKDPFADMDDGFEDDFGMDDGLSEPAGMDQSYDSELPLDTSADFDQFGDPIVHDQVDPAYAEDQEPQYEAPTHAAQAPERQQHSLAPKPFIKTPMGLASVGAGVVVLGLVGFVAVKSIGGSGEMLIESAPPSPEQLAPSAGDPNFNANTQPTQSAVALITEPKPLNRLPSPAEQLAGVTFAPKLPDTPETLVEQPVASAIKPQASGLQEVQGISTSDEVARLKASISHQREETEELKTAVASLTQGISKLSAYAERDHEEQSEIKDQLDALAKRFDEAPKSDPSVVAMPASKRAVTVNAEAPKALPKPVGEPSNPNAPGRFRLPGLKIVEATESGKMAVVTKTANGRTFTLFKGERLGTPRGSMAVTEVKDDGFLILVGEEYYIDKVSEEKPNAAPVEVAKVQKVEKPTRRQSAPKTKPAEAAPAVTTTFTLNAVYDNGTSFGVVNSEGDFKSYRIGDELPGAGRVTGLDGNGNLKAGNKVIKSLY